MNEYYGGQSCLSFQWGIIVKLRIRLLAVLIIAAPGGVLLLPLLLKLINEKQETNACPNDSTT